MIYRFMREALMDKIAAKGTKAIPPPPGDYRSVVVPPERVPVIDLPEKLKAPASSRRGSKIVETIRAAAKRTARAIR